MNKKEDPNDYWFWLQPLPPFEVRYAPNWEGKGRGFIGPFPFRAIAERERVDRLISGESRLRLIPGKRKEV